MDKFIFSNKYGIYPDCCFQTGKYSNGNLAVEIWQDILGPVTKVTVNPDIRIPWDMIAIKNYSENEGMVEWLISRNIIEETPSNTVILGYVEVPIHRLTKYGRIMLGLV